jgi:two-component system cell cycle response regulator DivK
MAPTHIAQPRLEGGSTTVDAASAHILVIEDNPDNQQIITELLYIAGCQHVTVRSSGWQGLRAARESMPRVDLILLDIQLPAEDGYAVLRRIRETPKLQHVRVVAVTADAFARNVAKARAAGFDGFIGKPLDFQLFPEQVLALLHGEEIWAGR